MEFEQAKSRQIISQIEQPSQLRFFFTVVKARILHTFSFALLISDYHQFSYTND